jgi:hypothetical protein
VTSATLVRVAGDRPLLLGVLTYLGIAVAPTLFLWAAVRLGPALFDLLAGAASMRRRRRGPQPVGPSLESLVVDLRRLRAEVRGPGPPTQVRRVALLAAYDDVLLDVCRAADVGSSLAEAPPGERPYARLLTEAAIEEAGIALDPPYEGPAAA